MSMQLQPDFHVLVLLVTVAAASPTQGAGAIVSDATQVASKEPQLVVDAKGLSGDPVVSVDISSDGALVAAASGKEVRVWQLPDQRLYATLRGYREPGGYYGGTIQVVRFIPGSHRLAVAVSDNTPAGSTRIYDLTRPDRIEQLLAGHKGCTQGLAVSSDGKHLGTYGCDGQMFILRHDDDNHWTPSFVGSNAWESDGIQYHIAKGYFGFVDDRHLLNLALHQQHHPLFDAYLDSPHLSHFPRSVQGVIDNLRSALIDLRPTTVNTLSFDLRADLDTCTAVAGTSKRDSNSRAEYWAATYSHYGANGKYTGHKYFPSSISLREVRDENSTRLVAASGDQLGEVHIWDGSSLERIARFAPRNWQLYGVDWSEDGSAVRFATRAYPYGQYNFNHYGPITHEFNLVDRQLSLRGYSADTDVTEAKTIYAFGYGETFAVRTVIDQGSYKLRLQRSGGWYDLNPWDYSASYDELELPATRWLDQYRFGKPYCYAAVTNNDPSEPPRIIVGTDTGTVEEFEIVQTTPNSPYVLSSVRRFVGHASTVTGISIRGDGQAMATSSWDGTVRLWSLGPAPPAGDVDYFANGTSVVSVPPDSNAHRAGIRDWDVITTFNGKPYFERFQQLSKGEHPPGTTARLGLVRRDSDGTEQPMELDIKLIDAPSYVEPYLTVFFSNEGEWVAYTPRGYYDATPIGERYVGWHINRERHEPALFYGVEQFRQDLYRPDIVTSTVDQLSEDRGMQAANRARNRPPTLYPDLLGAPTVAIRNPRSPYSIQGDTLTVSIESSTPIEDPLKRLEVRVGDALSGSEMKLISSTHNSESIDELYEAVVAVPVGSNEVSVRAFSESEKSSTTARLTVRREGPKSRTRPRLFVLAIGISKYQDEEHNLSWAAKDAQEFANAWKLQAGRFYSEVETQVLTDQDATVANIRDKMGWLADSSNVRPADVAIIFLAGHGVFNQNGLWYFGGHELDTTRLNSTAVSGTELSDLIDVNIGCQRVFFADTCHASAFRGTPSAQQFHPYGRDFVLSQQCLSMVSCIRQQRSIESDKWENGAFTESIVRALTTSEADKSPRDGRLTFDEIFDFTKHTTIALASSEGVEQTPAQRLVDFVSDVFLATTVTSDDD